MTFDMSATAIYAKWRHACSTWRRKCAGRHLASIGRDEL